MEFLIPCPCGKNIAITKSQAGQAIQCDCGQTVQAPTLRGFAGLQVVESETKASAGANSLDGEPRNVWKGWRAPLMAVLAVGFVCAGLYAAYHIWDSYRYDTRFTPDEYIAQQNEYLDQYGPDELTILWTNYQAVGLRQRQPPEFHIYNEFSKEQAYVGRIAGTVSGAFLVGMVCVWLSTLFAKRD